MRFRFPGSRRRERREPRPSVLPFSGPWRRRPAPTVREIGGRRFVDVDETTVRHDLHAWSIVRSAGLEQLTKRDDEEPAEFGERLMARLVETGAAIRLVACGLVPEGTPSLGWTPEIAAETEAFLGSVHLPEDKARVRSLMLGVLADFLAEGIVRPRTTPSSSAQTDGSPTRLEGGANGTA